MTALIVSFLGLPIIELDGRAMRLGRHAEARHQLC